MRFHGFPWTLGCSSPRIVAIASGFVAMVMVAAICGPTPDADAASRARVAAKERVIRTCANQLRAFYGVAPLHYSRSLSKAARFQSRNMAHQRYFDHTDPAGRGVARRVKRYTHYYGSRVGENISAGRRTSKAACHGWFESARHRANILNPKYTSIGTGYATGGSYRRYYTQVFGIAR